MTSFFSWLTSWVQAPVVITTEQSIPLRLQALDEAYLRTDDPPVFVRQPVWQQSRPKVARLSVELSQRSAWVTGLSPGVTRITVTYQLLGQKPASMSPRIRVVLL